MLVKLLTSKPTDIPWCWTVAWGKYGAALLPSIVSQNIAMQCKSILMTQCEFLITLFAPELSAVLVSKRGFLKLNSSHCDLGATANTLFVLIFYIISNLSFSGTLCWKKPAIQQSISSAINCKLILCGNEASSGLWSPLAWVEPQRGSHQNLSFWPNTPLLPSSLLSSSDLVSFHTQSWFSSRLLKLSLV